MYYDKRILVYKFDVGILVNAQIVYYIINYRDIYIAVVLSWARMK